MLRLLLSLATRPLRSRLHLRLRPIASAAAATAAATATLPQSPRQRASQPASQSSNQAASQPASEQRWKGREIKLVRGGLKVAALAGDASSAGRAQTGTNNRQSHSPGSLARAGAAQVQLGGWPGGPVAQVRAWRHLCGRARTRSNSATSALPEPVRTLYDPFSDTRAARGAFLSLAPFRNA